jgi:hypothetical protein
MPLWLSEVDAFSFVTNTVSKLPKTVYYVTGLDDGSSMSVGRPSNLHQRNSG